MFKIKNSINLALKLIFMVFIMVSSVLAQNRIRELGIHVGILSIGEHNAITDVQGVLVGHKSVTQEDSIRTGVTVILPHDGNLFQDKVMAAAYVGNGFGKFVGYTQIEELGTIETPIALTNTLNAFLVANALIDYALTIKENQDLRSINPVVGETNDGYLNNIQKRAVTKQDVFDAILNARSGTVSEGSIGAGTGTICFGFKGGIGTSSRVLPTSKGSYTVGVLVQTNFGGVLEINGLPIGKELNQYYLKNDLEDQQEKGSCMIVVATDAPLSNRNLKRLAKRAILGLAKTGGFCSNGSGDYVIAFSTHPSCRISSAGEIHKIEELKNWAMSPLFLAVVEATQEAIYNSLFMATKVTGYKGHTIEPIPIDKVIKLFKKYNLLK